MNNVPYTYYLEWADGTKYYGVRYAKDCHPSDLFVTYFTSSGYVADYIKENGMPDIIEIRKTFTGKDKINESINWEKRVLDRLNAANRPDYLNKRNSKGINYSDPDVSFKRNKNMKKAINLPAAKQKRKITDSLPETKEKRRMAAIKREADPIKRHNRLGKAFSQDAIDKRKKSLAITNQLPSVKNKRSAISKEINSRPELLEANKTRFLGVTWEERIGVDKADEFKKKMSELKKEWHKNNPDWVNPSKGKPNPKLKGLSAGKKHYKYDHTIYSWENITTGELLYATRQDFQLLVNAKKSNVYKLIKGTCKSVKGFKLYHN